MLTSSEIVSSGQIIWLGVCERLDQPRTQVGCAERDTLLRIFTVCSRERQLDPSALKGVWPGAWRSQGAPQMYKLKQYIKTAPKFNCALILYQYATKLSSTCNCDRSLLQANGTGCRCAHASRYGSTASIISLLTHICISKALNIVTHPKLTYEHQSPSGIAHPTLQPQLFRFLHTLARFKFLARHGISCWQKADAVSSPSQSR